MWYMKCCAIKRGGVEVGCVGQELRKRILRCVSLLGKYGDMFVRSY